MIDPFLSSLAAALGGQAATALGAGGKKALEKVRELVQRKSENDGEVRAALDAADDRPADHPKVQALAERLDEAGQHDPEFAQRLRTAGAEIHQELAPSEEAVVNHNSGNVDNLIQTRMVQGDITFNK